MPRPLGKEIGQVWTLRLHPDDSRDLQRALESKGYEPSNEGLTDFIFHHAFKKGGKAKSDLLDKIAQVMEDPAKAALVEKTLKGIFSAFGRR